MKIAIDTYYYSDDRAYTVGVLFEDWADIEPLNVLGVWASGFSAYIPGEFYKRELPCILGLLSQISINDLDTIILDGFVKLPGDKAGLGMHLWEALGYPRLSIIGVAKTKFRDCETISEPCKRGIEAINPLWVNTNSLISDQEASECIKKMAGDYRLPRLLKILDEETKKFK